MSTFSVLSRPLTCDVLTQAGELSDSTVAQIIALQRAWQADRKSADPQAGFLATCFSERELSDHFERGSTFFLASDPQGPAGFAGFAMTTPITEFTQQYDGTAGSSFALERPVDLSAMVYLYQVVVRRGLERNGHGRALVRKVLEHHQPQGVLADVLVSPVPNIPSIRFFERMGFERVGRLRLSGYRDFGELVSEVYVGPQASDQPPPARKCLF